MPSFARHRLHRGRFAALVICLALLPVLAGCAEDRSNLIPQETSSSLIAKLNRIDQLAAQGVCFEGQEVARSAQVEINEGDFDPKLKRSLSEGFDEMVALLGDSDYCTESETPPEETPSDTGDEPTDTGGSTGATGTTDTGPTTTGGQGSNPDDDQNPPTDDGTGDQPQTPPDTTPDQPTTPPTTNPPTPTPPGPGSGGIGPG